MASRVSAEAGGAPDHPKSVALFANTLHVRLQLFLRACFVFISGFHLYGLCKTQEVQGLSSMETETYAATSAARA